MSRKLLGCLYVKELCHEYTPGSPPVFFFDRNPQNFPAIIDMYVVLKEAIFKRL
jgi:hypothetical protein